MKKQCAAGILEQTDLKFTHINKKVAYILNKSELPFEDFELTVLIPFQLREQMTCCLDNIPMSRGS